MIDFADGGLNALTVPAPAGQYSERFACKTCSMAYFRDGFVTRHGKRAPECRVCERKRYTENRRKRLGTRKCMSCRGSFPFEQFPQIVRGGRLRLGMRCSACVEKIAPPIAPPADNTVQTTRAAAVFEGRVGATSSIDFTLIAQEMLYPDRAKPRDYFTFTQAERDHMYAVARELTRRYSPAWKPHFDDEPPAVETLLGEWARVFLLTAPLPAKLTDFIAERVIVTADDPAEQPLADVVEWAINNALQAWRNP